MKKFLILFRNAIVRFLLQDNFMTKKDIVNYFEIVRCGGEVVKIDQDRCARNEMFEDKIVIVFSGGVINTCAFFNCTVLAAPFSTDFHIIDSEFNKKKKSE
ncbi:hypothetical protein Phi19:2_gp060 [Cellulophaga phage phi19:2]|uniref:Uncharacterized protein n=3 Tax=Cellulophaga phage phiST TaxID=756282 RepID=M4SL92_9CAUD|nr:hypothetical protein CGPG_00049 [Cellulophaga phage phiST]AGH56748.1 hypothetical protein CGPG_00049 [Cellulophaga phage phiST]AGO47199.1 hypothetical protein PhiST_gp060 [Cellulophaga phage phiST]AGO48695.1 hypothetical protein Phi19:2_gp060 [Cellulophaga phage phi19:2]AGO49065.1 hypothetical protein Phi13:1_gp054 [Cellulophaga phage phi13:1]